MKSIEEANILIADDEPANVLLLQRLLEKSGFSSIRTTTDPRQIMSLFEMSAPEISAARHPDAAL